jgi:hypothetical protein
VNPSEAEIRRAVEGLKGRWGAFEMLVGRWAQIYYGERFAQLKVRGRKNEVTIAKWPDALSEGPGGSWDCLEATHSSDWWDHLLTDVKRIEKLSTTGKQITGFVFVAWAPDPDPDKRRGARELIVTAGVPQEAVDLVFEPELANSLTQGRYAHLWRESLSLPFDARPFRWVGAGKGLAGIDAGGGPFRPRAEEFYGQLVHQPALLEAVLARLRSVGIAEVRGRGAAGKTVLAEHVLQHHLSCGAQRSLEGDTDVSQGQSGRPAYYIKLGSYEQRSDHTQGLTEALARKADKNVLFVVDDIHLDPQGTLDLKDAWESIGRKGQILLLGREQRRDLDARVGARSLGEEELALQLVVEGEDLLGIYRRLARVLQNEAEPPLPPEDAIAGWLELFGGDLVIFSVALAARLPRMLRAEDWELDAADAAELVKARYLRGLSEDERSELVNLALLAESEIGVPIGLTGSGLEKSRERGLVVRSSWSDGDPGEVLLAHPGFGGLVLVASEEQVLRENLFSWAERDTPFAMRLGLHFKERGEVSAAAQAWGLALVEMSGLAQALASLPEEIAAAVLDGLEDLGLPEGQGLDETLTAEFEPILASILDRTSQLPGVLRTSATWLPQTHETVIAQLGKPHHADALLGELGRLEPGLASQRLRSWLAAEPELAGILARRLEDRERLERFLKRSEDLAVLLGSSAVGAVFSAMDAPAAFAEVFAARPAMKHELVGRILVGRIDAVPRAIRQASAFSPPLERELRAGLSAREVRERFADYASSLRAADLIGLIRFAVESDGELTVAIEDAIEPAAREALIEHSRNEAVVLRGFENLSQKSDLAREVVDAVRGPDWTCKPRSRRRGKGPEGPIARALRDDSTEAINFDLGSLVVFLAFARQDGGNGELAMRVTEVLRAPENRERVVHLAEQLGPAPLHQSLVWAKRDAPELCEGILARLKKNSVRARWVEEWIQRGTFESIAGLLTFLEKERPALATRVRDQLDDSRHRRQLLETGYRSNPSGWAAILKRDALAATLLPEVSQSRWQRYWRRQPAEAPNWLATLGRALFRHDRIDLQAAPAESVVLNSGPEHWNSPAISLGQLGSVLHHGRELGEDTILSFLWRIDVQSFLAENFLGRASGWSIARLLVTASSDYKNPVRDLIRDDSLTERVRRDARIEWRYRDPRENGGVLALNGGLLWAGSPGFVALPRESLVLAALESSSGVRLNLSHVVVWVGLRRAVSEGNRKLRLPDGDVPSRHLALFRDAAGSDPKTQVVNRWMVEWLERAQRDNWTLAPDPGGTELPISV